MKPYATYAIGCALLKDGRIYNISTFTGTKKECVDFINREQKAKMIDDMIRSEFVVNLAYEPSSKDDTESWLTLGQLAEMGAVILK